MIKDYIALLISGEIRTFIFKDQIFFFQTLMDDLKIHFKHIHVYLILKIPDKNINVHFIKSIQGIENFKELLNILNPIYKYFFYDFNYKSIYTPHNSQLKLIDMCIDQAIMNETNHNIKYDLFFRVRPDSCFLINELNFHDKYENKIYTSIKFDAIGSDQSFIFNQYILHNWWINFVKKLIIKPMLCPPEYAIFEKYNNMVEQSFQCWLIRDYNILYSWNNHILLNTKYKHYFKDDYDKLLINISHDEYINEINKIIDIIPIKLEIDKIEINHII
jgi:hypothetical protein